ncbi:Kiwa anti-phage protein KwaB-like domain-containing protein [Mesorhizobium sp. WSM2239]|uniref:Kiwa anti-phage protein KwaB-like domain-containing protein n=2 Tax=unclassified Mesorhizobium TaxID=325217 RepID=A0AAU8D5U7_9HYPH
MTALNDLRDFDVDAAEVTLWTFKTSRAGGTLGFKGRWVETSEALDNALREAVKAERAHIEEMIEYGLLAQNNEASALRLDADETHASWIVDVAEDDSAQNRVRNLKDLRNSGFYAIKLVQGETVLYGVKKTDASWHTRRVQNAVSAIFVEDVMGIEESPSFDIAKSVDFFIVGDSLLVADKGRFESIMQYKAAHREDFAALTAEPAFLAILADVGPIVAFVGDNKIHLRRASAIRQKAYYSDAAFMNNLRARRDEMGFNFEFDAVGRIIATAEHCREIFQALLDHRLLSRLSENIYDVQDAVSIAV